VLSEDADAGLQTVLGTGLLSRLLEHFLK
jgi:hypothetical protein